MPPIDISTNFLVDTRWNTRTKANVLLFQMLVVDVVFTI